MADILAYLPQTLPEGGGLLALIGDEVITGTVTLSMEPSSSLDASTYNSDGTVTPGSIEVAVGQVIGPTNSNVDIIANGTGDIRFFVGGTTLVATIDDVTHDITFATTSRVLVTDADGLLVNSVIVPTFYRSAASVLAVAAQIDQSIFTADRAMKLVGITETHTVKEAAGTLHIMPVKQVGTQAAAAGTPLITNNTNLGFDGTAAAETPQTGVLVAVDASVTFAAGDRLGLDYTGDVAGELAGVVITYKFQLV